MTGRLPARFSATALRGSWLELRPLVESLESAASSVLRRKREPVPVVTTRQVDEQAAGIHRPRRKRVRGCGVETQPLAHACPHPAR
ncbi:hypothetical protein KKH27_04160 [bacterium]|nr:hypothetical protein [bacterium]